MSAVDNILSMIENLSAADKTALKIALSKTAHHNPRQLEEFVTSERFAKGRVCPHCGCVHVVRNGKSADFEIPRKAHKRGKETKKRGLSKEQVCVPCAVNRGGMSIAKASNLGRVSAKDIHGVFDGRIDEESTLVTDKMNAYVKFAEKNELDLVQLKGGKGKKGIYSIQHINNYHSRLKRFMMNFCGVSTKYLNNYLVWHNFVNYARETEVEKKSILLRFVLTEQKMVTCREISKRSALPVAG